MCGLTAVLNSESNLVSGLDKFITDATVVTQLRGPDSTGMYQINGNLELQSYKKAVDGSTFITMPKAAELLADADVSYVTVVHNRKATTGKINNANAHPFIHENNNGEDDFALVHNGTIEDWDKKKFSTDTEALAARINDNGAQGLDDLYGAWSVIWTDMESQITHMATNGERPLHYAFVKDKSVVLICSEAGMLSWLAERNKLELEDDAIYEAETHQTYAFPLHDVRQFTKTPIKKVIPRQTKTYSYSNVTDNRRPRIISEVKEIERQARANTLTDFSSLTTVTPLTTTTRCSRSINGLSQEETDALFNWTGEHEVTARAVPIYKDTDNFNVYLDVISNANPYAPVGNNDAIVVRCTSATQAANLMRYHEIEITVKGMQEDGYFIGLPPTAGQLGNGILALAPAGYSLPY